MLELAFCALIHVSLVTHPAIVSLVSLLIFTMEQVGVLNVALDVLLVTLPQFVCPVLWVFISR